MNRPPFLNGFLAWTGFLASIFVFWLALAAWNSAMQTAAPGATLTSTGWNAMVSNLSDLDTRTTAASASISNLNSTVSSLSWTVSSLAAWAGSSKAPFVRVSLAQCSNDGCSGNHTINTWHNVASFNYAWNTVVLSDATAFTHNGKGLVTVLKPGTYRIRLETLTMPSANTNWVQALCPAINWTSNCLWVTGIYSHGYHAAGYWSELSKEFTVDLSANQTVGFWYYTPAALTYWAYDNYTALQVEKLN